MSVPAGKLQSVEIKERPILFNGAMVRAILDGRKTQTRRIVKFPIKDYHFGCDLAGNEIGEREANELCPYGAPGERIWVRETTEEDCVGSASLTRYTADGRTSAGPWDYSRKVRPSIHLPRALSRITLEITSVRVERLQDISDADAKAEGVDGPGSEAAKAVGWCEKPRRAFSRLWEKIYGAGSWDANPWVWVIEFNRI